MPDETPTTIRGSCFLDRPEPIPTLVGVGFHVDRSRAPSGDRRCGPGDDSPTPHSESAPPPAGDGTGRQSRIRDRRRARRRRSDGVGQRVDARDRNSHQSRRRPSHPDRPDRVDPQRRRARRIRPEEARRLPAFTQFKTPPTEGTNAEFLVERLDSDGLYVLSVPGAVQKADWGNLDVGQTVEGNVIGVNKGGLEVEVAHHTGFMPAGQIDIRHIPDISIMLNERVTCRVTQLDKRKGRLVLSRRVIIEEERAKNRESILATLEPGQRKTVVVTSIQPYGVFADLGGIDGLIHVSEISHDRVRDPGDHVKVGEELEVVVTKIDTSGDQPKIGLSRKAVVADPRAAIGDSLEVGATVSGTVRKIADFGAFVEVAEGIEGLLHISEISHKRIDRIEGVLREGEVLQVKILSIDSHKGRVSLSKKALEARPAATGRGKAAMAGESPIDRKIRRCGSSGPDSAAISRAGSAEPDAPDRAIIHVDGASRDIGRSRDNRAFRNGGR